VNARIRGVGTRNDGGVVVFADERMVWGIEGGMAIRRTLPTGVLQPRSADGVVTL